MKKLLFIFSLFLAFFVKAQEKIMIKKNEITIPIGKKVMLNPQTEGNKIVNFEITDEQSITDKVDMMDLLKNFKKDNITDNSIEFIFSEAQMMNTPYFILKTIQKTGKKMTFKAKIRLKGSPLYSSTSIIPVVNNAISLEQWQNNIDSIFLYDFVLQD
ncbi:hypothetical protein [Chryseobacterium sp. BIGb0232]|uniref:hypothetical protein n=1 Tax=Chryseobacterium sp. BIGb0232 TaxID=2940598 RepID=UPI000F48E357|nr:hypothetical protein [Chryseobacterium sp. BIGb0232]MCS4302152.1 hypothetical protein [Chryseobacterium sp. BIGb0232]ROS18098.1 hypothetical protein EDF65_2488 [Chryseobacterium nakagawai]